MCQWCSAGYWECDGEGGACPPRDEPPPHAGRPQCDDGLPPSWKIDCRIDPLKYRNGTPVPAQGGGNVWVMVKATHSPLTIELNGCDVGQGEQPGGTLPPYRDPPRGRRWKINKVVTLCHPDGGAFKDKDGNDVSVRVQSYVYARDADHPEPPAHCEGQGPKVRLYALEPGAPDVDRPGKGEGEQTDAHASTRPSA
jgi:hypothetical protein